MKYQRFSVLYVDDELANLKTFRFQFEDQFKIVTASGGAEALQIMDQEPIAVLLSDQRMPAMSGSELCEAAKSRHPEVVRMIVSAYSDISSAVSAINTGNVSRYILKPWREEEMSELLRNAIDAHEVGVLTRQLQGRLLKADQQTTTTYLAGRVLHEMGTPMATVNRNLEGLNEAIGELRSHLTAPTEKVQAILADVVSALDDTKAAAQELSRRLDRFRKGAAESHADGGSDLASAVRAAASLVGAEVEKRACLVLNVAETCRVAMDSLRLSQVLVNLLTNAAEATPAGAPAENTITVSIQVGDGDASLWVEDTGSEIPEALLPNVFEPFTSAQPASPERGLGLAIVRDLVQRSSGTIRAERRESRRGTRFVVTLPKQRD